MSSKNLPVLRHEYFLVKYIFKSSNNSFVKRWSAEKHDSIADTSLFHHAVEVIVDYGIAKPGDEIFEASTFLCVGDQV